eukprot:SAG31_NODE_5622_length_2419_cov_3.644397_2_plen_123_part_00
MCDQSVIDSIASEKCEYGVFPVDLDMHFLGLMMSFINVRREATDFLFVPKVGEEGQRAVGLRGEPSVLHVPEAGQERRPEYAVPGWVRISQYQAWAVCVCVCAHGLLNRIRNGVVVYSPWAF